MPIWVSASNNSSVYGAFIMSHPEFIPSSNQNTSNFSQSQPQGSRRVALITGGSRGIGAATALTLAEHGYDVIITYRNKAARAREVIARIEQHGQRGLALACDMTDPAEIQHGFAEINAWTDRLDILVLNASGGMERDLVAADPDYPLHINRDAQLNFVNAALPLFQGSGTITLVTSHWAYLYGQITQVPAYEPVAMSKHAGEQALKARQAEFAMLGLRLLIVTGDLIEGTITPKLLERTAPGLLKDRQDHYGKLPTATEMGQAIALAALNPDLASGSVVVVGAPLESMFD
jgi:NAD(P)-dependent dehydrogenase (short-subunit alcohol dehydrogenase family)